MKANELMIGDWVLCDRNAQSDYEFDVVDYQPYKIMHGEDIDYACEKNMRGDADVYQPIPLTPEILEKNGWAIPRWTTNFWESHFGKGLKGDIGISKGGWFLRIKDIVDNWFVLIVTINYVHELQHALRLCGIEKEIEL